MTDTINGRGTSQTTCILTLPITRFPKRQINRHDLPPLNHHGHPYRSRHADLRAQDPPPLSHARRAARQFPTSPRPWRWMSDPPPSFALGHFGTTETSRRGYTRPEEPSRCPLHAGVETLRCSKGMREKLASCNELGPPSAPASNLRHGQAVPTMRPHHTAHASAYT
ncbi:hypothetical protein LZ30DRAFT_705988, partial [Colletotrichum cereale]